jgi:hypothetical protein
MEDTEAFVFQIAEELRPKCKWTNKGIKDSCLIVVILFTMMMDILKGSLILKSTRVSLKNGWSMAAMILSPPQIYKIVRGSKSSSFPILVTMPICSLCGIAVLQKCKDS